VSDSRTSGLVLEGEDLAAARAVLSAVVLREAITIVDEMSIEDFIILRKLGRALDTIGLPCVAVPDPLDAKAIKVLRRAVKDEREWTQFRIDDWDRVDDSQWETDAHRSTRDYLRSQLEACERLDAALPRKSSE
jgi:hypothetical protein